VESARSRLSVARRRRSLQAAAALAAAALVTFAAAGGTAASFNARTANPAATYALTALYAPTSLTATTAGAGVNLSWTAGANGNGYSILGVANGTSSNCAAATTASLGTSVGTTYADSSRSTPQGTWFCYEVKTKYSAWTSVASNPRVAAQIGVVVSTIVAANGGTAGKLDTGDTITATFNQPITTASGPSGTNSVCAIGGATIVIGTTTTSGTCVATETTNFGKLTGGTSSTNVRYAATYAWNAALKQLTITIGSRTSGLTAPTTSGTWTLGPTTTATKLLSTTGSLHTCDTNTGGGSCLPTLTGSF
jgi:hypothetical protein